MYVVGSCSLCVCAWIMLCAVELLLSFLLEGRQPGKINRLEQGRSINTCLWIRVILYITLMICLANICSICMVSMYGMILIGIELSVVGGFTAVLCCCLFMYWKENICGILELVSL